jgi:peptidoglycan hydrolase-like protein with peptidoglycan-binding domain
MISKDYGEIEISAGRWNANPHCLGHSDLLDVGGDRRSFCGSAAANLICQLVDQRPGGYVLAIQEAAYSRGSYGGPLDDLVGPNTVNGIRGLQTYLGLSVDGCAGPITWGAVRNLLQYIGPPPGYVADGPLYGINFGARSQYYSYNGCWASFAYRGTSSPVMSLRYYEFAGGLVGLTPLPPLTHGGTLPYCGTV